MIVYNVLCEFLNYNNLLISLITLSIGILFISEELNSLEDIEYKFFLSGVNFFGSFGPNNLIKGQYPVDNIWLTPLSLEIAIFKNLEVAITISILL